jgi:hypothetical protein
MSSDLVALAIALTLGTGVVILGLRRSLSETTRNGLPRFGEDSERTAATVGLYEGVVRPRRPPSPRQRRWMIWTYLLLGLTFAVAAVLSADGRVFHAILAVALALNTAVIWPKRPHTRDDSAS